MKFLIAAAVALVALLGVAPVADAQTVDSVTGTAATGIGRSYTVYTFDARSGPLGENPTGTVTLDGLFGGTGPLEVRCLSVSGDRASMLVAAPPNSLAEGLAISVDDGAPGRDKIDEQPLMVLPRDCPVPGTVSEPTVSGDVVVVDSQPPSMYAQCRQGGWVTYGYASHAECIDGVHQLARQKCIFERVATGITAFRAKYGLGPSDDHAMRHCVKLYTGL